MVGREVAPEPVRPGPPRARPRETVEACLPEKASSFRIVRRVNAVTGQSLRLFAVEVHDIFLVEVVDGVSNRLVGAPGLIGNLGGVLSPGGTPHNLSAAKSRGPL